MQTICSLTVSITGFPKTHSDSVAYQDVKEPWYIIAKNAMLVFMLTVLKYIFVNRTVCNGHRKKKVIYKKSDFPFALLSLLIILAIEVKLSRDQIKIFLI